MKIKLSDGTDIFFVTHGVEQEIVGDKLIEKPTLLFLHGGPGLTDHNLYVSFWSSFKDVAQVVFLDFRGHGKSGGWEQVDKFNLHTWAADVKEFCDKLGIIKPIVVGFSFGGWVALEYAISYPDHPGALILANTEAHIDVEKRAGLYEAKAIRKGYSAEKAAEIAETVRHLGDGSIESKKTAQIYIEACAPVLSIAGELDVEHPVVCAQEMCADMVNAKVEQVVLKGVGDPVDHDDPTGVAKVVRDFLLEFVN